MIHSSVKTSLIFERRVSSMIGKQLELCKKSRWRLPGYSLVSRKTKKFEGLTAELLTFAKSCYNLVELEERCTMWPEPLKWELWQLRTDLRKGSKDVGFEKFSNVVMSVS